MIIHRFDTVGIYAGTKNVPNEHVLKPNEFLSIGNLVKPFNENGELIESATQTEVDEHFKNKRNEFNYDLAIIINSLELGSERIALGIVGEDEYIESQIKIYNLKFLVASGLEQDLYIGDKTTLQLEAESKGISESELKTQIISKNSEYIARKKMFLLMIEFARKKTQKYIDNNLFEHATNLFDLMRGVTRGATVLEIQMIFNSIVMYQ